MKRLLFILMIILAAALLFTACAPKDEQAADEQEQLAVTDEATNDQQPDTPDIDQQEEPDTDNTDIKAESDDYDSAESTRIVDDAVERLTAGEPDAAKAAELRALLFEHLPYTDWSSDSTEAGDKKMDLLVWLGGQDITDEQEIKALFTLHDKTDGAYSDAYAAAITNTFLLNPRLFVTLLADEAADAQQNVGVMIAYGAWQREDQVGAALQQLMAEDMSEREIALLRELAANMLTMNT